MLAQWTLWFFGYNAILFWLLGWFYLAILFPFPPYHLTFVNKITIALFITFSFIGHLGLLALLPGIIIIIPLLLLFPNRSFILVSSVLLATIANLALLIDIYCYTHYRFHLNGILLSMILSGETEQIFTLSWLEWLYGCLLIAGLLLLEIGLARRLWRSIIQKKPWRFKLPLLGGIGSSLLLSYYLIAWGTLHNFQALTQQTYLLPFYDNFFTTLFPIENGIRQIETIGCGKFVQPKQPDVTLHYPLHSLVFHPLANPPNILLIVIDTWRFDMLNSLVTPHLAQFAKTCSQYTHHYSGGNSTQAGIFSLFYGIPASYWAATANQHIRPVLFEEMSKQNYQLGIFASAELHVPAFAENVFWGIKKLALETPGATPYERDVNITQKFKHFIQTRTTAKPFFTFLFYDSAHSYCQDGNPIQLFKPAVTVCNRLALTKTTDPTPYFNRYKNALYFVDQQIAQDLELLRKEKLLENTIVIVTGDHGNEFNDNKLGFWEHSSNYSHYQVQTPFIMYWPKQHPQTVNQTTNHYDLVATLLPHALGCQNQASDYSVGLSLFTPTERKYLLAGSYIDFGIIEKDRITEIFPTGNYAIYDLKLQQLPNVKPRSFIMASAFTERQKFYK